jgi:hypothetical protein
MSETIGNTALKEDVNENNLNTAPNTQEHETKKGKSAKSNLIVLTTRPISDDELRTKLNQEFGQNNVYYKVLKEAVDNLTLKQKENLRNLILMIREGIKPEFVIKNGKVSGVKFNRTLSDEELDNYITMIPVEMYFINDYMEGRALDMELAEHLKEFHITEEIFKIKGGTEKERLRAAEYNSMIQIFTTIIKNRVYYNLKNEIDAANRVYEALKKVANARIEDKKLFGKSNN